jgi:hypothetical protein
MALEVHDLSLLRAMAGRMVATAGQDGLGDVARVASELERSAGDHPDLVDMVGKVNELMEMCRSVARPDDQPAGEVDPHRSPGLAAQPA